MLEAQNHRHPFTTWKARPTTYVPLHSLSVPLTRRTPRPSIRQRRTLWRRLADHTTQRGGTKVLFLFRNIPGRTNGGHRVRAKRAAHSLSSDTDLQFGLSFLPQSFHHTLPSFPPSLPLFQPKTSPIRILIPGPKTLPAPNNTPSTLTTSSTSPSPFSPPSPSSQLPASASTRPKSSRRSANSHAYALPTRLPSTLTTKYANGPVVLLYGRPSCAVVPVEEWKCQTRRFCV